MEQQTADVFSTSIRDIPTGEAIKGSTMELKHATVVDVLRLTIPSSIAPIHGTLPNADASRAVTTRNMNISVQVSMSSSIRSIQVHLH